jgi:predicted transcriptional regulator YdeE
MVVQAPGFTVIGIAARTSNAREMTPDGVIPRQWERWMTEALAAQISNKLDSSVIALYTDYESDHNGEYTFVLGVKVSSAENVPPGMVASQIPAGRYTVLTSEKGPVGRVVFEAWQRIWSMSPAELGGARAYRADFEVYDQRASDSDNAQVDVYVGIV